MHEPASLGSVVHEINLRSSQPEGYIHETRLSTAFYQAICVSLPLTSIRVLKMSWGGASSLALVSRRNTEAELTLLGISGGKRPSFHLNSLRLVTCMRGSFKRGLLLLSDCFFQ